MFNLNFFQIYSMEILQLFADVCNNPETVELNDTAQLGDT